MKAVYYIKFMIALSSENKTEEENTNTNMNLKERKRKRERHILTHKEYGSIIRYLLIL